MRSAETYLEQYRRLIPGAAGQRELRDLARVDLCLHFLVRHHIDDVDAMPDLLRGYPAIFGQQPPRAQLDVLRHIAGGYASAMEWSAARRNHESSAAQTAYRVRGGEVEPQAVAQPSVAKLLDAALDTVPEFRDEKPTFARPGTARVRTAVPGYLEFKVPEIGEPSLRSFALPTRGINPAIAFSWSDLMTTAKAVDRREQEPSWPAWLPRLNLATRLERVEVDPLAGQLYSDGQFFVRGRQHIVGMLSSGKSTFLNALLFTICSADYGKRALVLTSDTASAAQLVTRLNLHGIPATLLSSYRNRETHLAAIHWSNASSDQQTALEAAAEQTRALGMACPLEGMQTLDADAFRTTEMRPVAALPLGVRPCDRLQQRPAKSAGTGEERWIDHTCPLIADCPTHSQQRSLGEARVYVMTAAAYLEMRPANHIVQRQLSFPELFQHLVDIVLVDEVDSIQARFDEAFCLEEVLLSASESPYAINTARGVMDAVQRRGGSQYSSPAAAQWHARLNQLQTSIALIFQILLSEGPTVGALVRNQSFTASSLLADLWRWVSVEASSPDRYERDVRFIVEYLGGLTERLLGESAQAAGVEPGDQDSRLVAILGMLDDIQQRMLLDCRADIDAIRERVKGTELAVFNIFSAPAGAKKKSVPGDRFPAVVIALSALTHACLALFSWLVRTQSTVEDDFDLQSVDVLRRMRSMRSKYGALIPLNPASGAIGLMFDGGTTESGASLRLVYHMGAGRFLLTHMDRLLSDLGQAGPHVLMLSGTSWAGGAISFEGSPVGAASTASPKYDVQVPVAAILRQPESELQAIRRSVFEMGPITQQALSVSGQPIAERHANLQQMAKGLCSPRAGTTELELQWTRNEDHWPTSDCQDRRRALVITNNYADARVFATAAARAGAGHHLVYQLVSDGDAQARRDRFGGAPQPTGPTPILLPRSRVAEFGLAPQGSVLVAPLGPISRGHNILNGAGAAAISTMYFVHRPHPRPDDLSSVVAEVNRFAIDLVNGTARIPDELSAVTDRGRWVRRQSRRLLDEALAARVAYSRMTEPVQTRFAWDLITLLWQTVGRGIRSGVPVYVRFADARFSPGAFAQQKDGPSSSCLRRCASTLRAALNDPATARIAGALYQPFLAALERMFAALDQEEATLREYQDV